MLLAKAPHRTEMDVELVFQGFVVTYKIKLSECLYSKVSENCRISAVKDKDLTDIDKKHLR
jgi:hypothetical protein